MEFTLYIGSKRVTYAIRYTYIKYACTRLSRTKGRYNLDKTSNKSRTKREYKEFSEQRAKKLYEELLIQFLRTKSMDENEAASRARQIIRKQCAIRGIEVWNWLKVSD